MRSRNKSRSLWILWNQPWLEQTYTHTHTRTHTNTHTHTNIHAYACTVDTHMRHRLSSTCINIIIMQQLGTNSRNLVFADTFLITFTALIKRGVFLIKNAAASSPGPFPVFRIQCCVLCVLKRSGSLGVRLWKRVSDNSTYYSGDKIIYISINVLEMCVW